MKKIVLILMTIALTNVFGIVRAQDKTELSDKALSVKYKQEIDILASEIKTIKLKLKADKDNSELTKDLAVKTEQLKDLKEKKQVIDTAIKSKAASEKAALKAERAAEKAERAKRDAERAAQKSQELKEKEK
ncbi:MAG: hypothetical protein LBR84_10970 [Tannerella sp.]|jgi:meiotically up-regulated gene 157 (Mug157) protein|nr:hypothetical protein [Tannerella sp.]